ncbi:zinc finger and BTB domain-containing protein 39-like [Lampetra fluviatilis]
MSTGEMEEPADEQISLSTGKQLSDLLRELSALWLRGSFCDAVVEVQSRRYLAHKAVLSSTCTYFRGIFLDTPCSNMGPFVVDFLTEKTFDQVLDFVYKGNVSVGREDLRELLKAAQNLGIECLEEVCRVFVMDDVEDCFPDKDTDATYISESGQYDCVEEGDDTPGCSYNSFGQCNGEDSKSPPPAKQAAQSSSEEDLPQFAALDKESASNTEPFPDLCLVKTEMPDGGQQCSFALSDENTPQSELQLDDQSLEILQSGQSSNNFLRAMEKTLNMIPLAGSTQQQQQQQCDLLNGNAAPTTAALVSNGQLRCQACGEHVEESVSCLREHSCGHLDMETLACRVCGAMFSHISVAVEHTLAHTGVALSACKHCGKKFLSEKSLALHYKSHCRRRRPQIKGGRLSWHPDPDAQESTESAPCQVCGVAVQKKMAALWNHARLHVDSELLSCRVCGLQSTRRNLVKHGLIHLGVFLFTCDACRKRFLFRNQLLRHQKERCRGQGEPPLPGVLSPSAQLPLDAACV